jgi:hypothetical protein
MSSMNSFNYICVGEKVFKRGCKAIFMREEKNEKKSTILFGYFGSNLLSKARGCSDGS